MPSTNIASAAPNTAQAANDVATSCHTPPPCKGERRRMQVLNQGSHHLKAESVPMRSWAHHELPNANPLPSPQPAQAAQRERMRLSRMFWLMACPIAVLLVPDVATTIRRRLLFLCTVTIRTMQGARRWLSFVSASLSILSAPPQPQPPVLTISSSVMFWQSHCFGSWVLVHVLFPLLCRLRCSKKLLCV